jgi:hypothetical protein
MKGRSSFTVPIPVTWRDDLLAWYTILLCSDNLEKKCFELNIGYDAPESRMISLALMLKADNSTFSIFSEG